MQKRNSIINIPLLAGFFLSIALHVAALYSRGIYTPAEPLLDSGRTVVQLTLIPTLASKAAKPEPIVEPPKEATEPKPIEEPQPVKTVIPVAPLPEPTVLPVPEPVTESATEPVAESVSETISDPVQESMPEPAAADSREQVASLIEDKGVRTAASAVQGITATYPRMSQRRGEEGTVVLSIQVLPTGKAGLVKVVESSGFKRLDEAAVKAAKKADYAPAVRFGQPVEDEIIQPLTFNLTQE